MLRPIVRYGGEGLTTPASPVPAVDADVRQLVDDMVDTMYAAPGVGLAAPQIGVPLRMFVIDLSVGKRSGELVVLINPEFVERDGMQLLEEGCLSVPGFTVTVPRPAHVVVRGLDEHGRRRVVDGAGLLARALQHEMDHLDGRLFLHRVRGIQREIIVRKIHKLARRGRW